MKKILLLLPVLLTCMQMMGADYDQSLSPYFEVSSGNKVEQFPLMGCDVDVSIAGVIADVKVKQVYKNMGNIPIEAVYVFPASTRAAVYAMKMTIGDRVISAEIKEKNEAKKIYEQAKEEGKSASLLEEERPNIFRMNVANIMPGDLIQVELFYTELLVPEKGEYSFVYPTVVGPRYSGENLPEPGEKDSQYLDQNQAVPYTFDIKVNIMSGINIASVTSSSHSVKTFRKSFKHTETRLNPEDIYGGNKDFILSYKLAGSSIESGLLLYEGEEENFFLLMTEPPAGLKSGDVVNREYIFILDVSGSMDGFPLNVSKKVIKELIQGLRPEDRFNIIFFAGGSAVLSHKSLYATKDNIKRALKMIKGQRGGGGTELLPALKTALNMGNTEGYSKTMVVLTDGYVSFEEEAFNLINKNLGKANLFAFGIGSSPNRYLIEGMSRAGKGESFIATDGKEAEKAAGKFIDYIKSPLLTDINVEFSGFDAYDIEPLAIPDLFARRPLTLFGKWRGNPGGTIKITGNNAKGPYSQTIRVEDAENGAKNSALRYLWARKKLEYLSDYNFLSGSDDLKQQIVDLSLKYNLLSKHTSFVAVDHQIRNKEKNLKKVEQKLPLPEGTNNNAVGSAPEPHEWTIIFILVIALFLFYRKKIKKLVPIKITNPRGRKK